PEAPPRIGRVIDGIGHSVVSGPVDGRERTPGSFRYRPGLVRAGDHTGQSTGSGPLVPEGLLVGRALSLGGVAFSGCPDRPSSSKPRSSRSRRMRSRVASSYTWSSRGRRG